MSKHKDYTKYSNREQRNEEKLIQEAQSTVDNAEFPVVTDEVAVEDIPEVVESVAKEGVVVNCLKLNVRVEPSIDAEVVGHINASTKLEVYEDESTDEFYKICTYSGVEGYCMKAFINILP